jgi:large subunit ribosomal protein L13
MKKTYTIDAEGKKLGRVASEVASLLMGKNLVTFVRNSCPDVLVNLVNTSKADINEKKKDEVEYANYSGFPGGQRIVTMKKTIEVKGFKEVFRKAIKGMLPKNKLQNEMLKNLKITE